MRNIVEHFNKAMEYVFGFVGILMIFIQTYAVLARNVLQIPTPWSDEILKLLFIWSIFICSALAFYSDSLIRLTLIEDSRFVKHNKKAIGIMKVIQYLAGLGISILLVQQLVTIVGTQLSTGESTTVLKYPLWLINTGILIGTLQVCIYGLMKLYECRKYFQK